VPVTLVIKIKEAAGFEGIQESVLQILKSIGL
jgi:hypothetical protein